MQHRSHLSFWEEQPALVLAISLLIGTSSPLFWQAPWNWAFPLLWVTYLSLIRAWASVATLFLGVLYSLCLYANTPSGNMGHFSIRSVQPHHSPFQKGLLYKGDLLIDRQKIPCSVHFLGKDRPKANRDYILKGKLEQRGTYEYAFKAKEWIPVEKTWSFAEFRYQMKEHLRQLLAQKMHRDRTASFLSSLLTGDVEERSLRYEFGRVGVQHILAISGFHFAILITFCSFFLGLFLPSFWRNVLLLVAINGYFLFVGSLPAVQRSWLTASFYLIGKLIGRHASGLNLLGVSLLIEVLLNPLVSANLGFQLSFVSCGGILLLNPLFSSKSLSTPSELSLFSQHGLLLLNFFRQAFVLTLAVNIAIFPLLLYHFHTFPLLGLLYNLFLPFLVSAALFGLLLTLLIHLFFPPIASFFFATLDWFTLQVLDLAAYPPLALDYSLTTTHFPAWLIPLYLFGLFWISLRSKLNPKSDSMGKVDSEGSGSPLTKIHLK